MSLILVSCAITSLRDFWMASAAALAWSAAALAWSAASLASLAFCSASLFAFSAALSFSLATCSVASAASCLEVATLPNNTLMESSRARMRSPRRAFSINNASTSPSCVPSGVCQINTKFKMMLSRHTAANAIKIRNVVLLIFSFSNESCLVSNNAMVRLSWLLPLLRPISSTVNTVLSTAPEREGVLATRLMRSGSGIAPQIPSVQSIKRSPFS